VHFQFQSTSGCHTINYVALATPEHAAALLTIASNRTLTIYKTTLLWLLLPLVIPSLRYWLLFTFLTILLNLGVNCVSEKTRQQKLVGAMEKEVGGITKVPLAVMQPKNWWPNILSSKKKIGVVLH